MPIPILPTRAPLPTPPATVIPLVNVDIHVTFCCAVTSIVLVAASNFRFPADVLIVVASATPI